MKARRLAGVLATAPLAALTGSAFAQAPVAPGAYDQAVQDRRAGRTDAALAELRALAQSTPNDADVWLNLGLALMQKRDFKAAEAALSRGLQLAPQDPDLRVADARLAYFDGRYAEARARLGPALAQSPTPEAQALLDQIAAAEQAPPPARWRVDAAVTYSDLSRKLPAWREWDLAAGRALGRGATLSLGLEQTSRFDLSNTYLHGEYAQRLGPAGFVVGYGGAPDAVYRPRNLVQAGLLAPAVRLGGAWRLEGELDASWANYPTGEVGSVQPQITLAEGDRFSVAARYIHTIDERRRLLEGYSVRALALALPGVRLDLGYAFAPDTSAGITLQTRTINGGVAVDLGRLTTVRLGAAYADQQVYTRQDFTLSVTRRFP
jgi:YaiO family outer membrane protein